jgi:HIRA B motif
MLTSNDGYCSVAVYDKEELGIPYEGESVSPAGEMLDKIPLIQEPPQIKTAEQPRPLTALDTWARKVESPTIAPATSPSRDNKRPMAATPAEAKPGENSQQQQKKKRRIAPTLISSL